VRAGHQTTLDPRDREGVTATADLSSESTYGAGLSPSGSLAPAARLDFEQVYETHFEFVWRSLRLLGIADESVEDAAQDTFSVVYRQLAAFEGRSALRTWLFAILQRVALNYRRTRRRKQSQLSPFADAVGNEPTPHAHAEAAEAARVIEGFCANLDAERRSLFVLAVLEDLPAVEVSAALGLPITKVYSRVHALREGLKRALAAREVEHGQ
jgi:RNA polymerase sigma-70 factor (ECF subfamily)